MPVNGERRHSGSRVILTNEAVISDPLQQALHIGMEWSSRGRAPVALLMLHLSHLHPPGPRAHHRRIAANLLDNAVQAHGGQVFACPNGDMLLLTEPDAAGRLVSTLSNLFRAETPGTDRLLALWTLPEDEALARAHLPATAHHPAAEDAPVPLGAIAAVEAVLASASTEQLIRRQTAVCITRQGVAPLYQELSASLAVLEAQTGTSVPFAADPYLFRHLAARLDRRILAAADAEALPGGPALHLILTMSSILSPGFARLAAKLPPGACLGIEVQFMEAVADLPRFTAARHRLLEAGCRLVLGGLDHAVLSLANPAALAPDLLKLDWSPRMLALPGRERRMLSQAIAAIGPDKVVLHRAETEAALAWGRAHGICRFQGRQVDAVLAAARLSTCRHADGCSLRDCIDRAAATGPAGRVGCRDLALLDASYPPAVLA